MSRCLTRCSVTPVHQLVVGSSLSARRHLVHCRRRVTVPLHHAQHEVDGLTQQGLVSLADIRKRHQHLENRRQAVRGP